MPVYTPNTTWVDGSGGGTPLSAARLNNMELGISPPYIAYTPTWTASGTAPAIGNALVTGRYVQIGKLVHCYGRVSFGSTSTFGTGTYSFALPVTASASVSGGASHLGVAFIYDNSANASTLPQIYALTATTMSFEYAATYLGANAGITNTTPWTWAVNDQIAWNFVYEAA
jgi:hypothetical protein